jgi:hypothetical protein
MIWLIALIIVVTLSYLVYKALCFLDGMDEEDWYE